MALADIVNDLPNELGMYYNWDFTKSLVDTVNGKEAVLANSATRTEIGVKITTGTDACTLGNLLRGGTVIEVDITDNPCSQNTENSRVFCFDADGEHGLVYKDSTGDKGWGVYLGSWNFYEGGDRTNRGYIQNCTLKFVVNANNYLSVYKDNTFIVTHDTPLGSKHTTWRIGSPETIRKASAIGLTVTGVRVYAKAPDDSSLDGYADTYTFSSAHMKALADAIREKTGKTGGLNILSMIDAIKELE